MVFVTGIDSVVELDVEVVVELLSKVVVRSADGVDPGLEVELISGVV